MGAKLLAWFQPQKTPHPWRQERGGRRDPYRVWVSEIMLQQTTIGAVTPKYQNFIEKLPSLRQLAAASDEELRPLVQGLGYYRRFGLLHKAAKQLVAGAGGRRPIPWPTTYEGWRELPGVGDYTAAAVTSFAFGGQTVALDGNGERILQRLLASKEPLSAKGKTLLKAFAAELLGKAPAGPFNEALMELGQKICIRKLPRCQLCPLPRYCQAYQLGEQNAIPVPPPKRAYEEVKLAMVVPMVESRAGLVLRSATAKFLKNQLGFATCIAKPAGLELDGLSASAAAKALKPLLRRKAAVAGVFRHAITHHKIAAEVRVVPIAATAADRLMAAGFQFEELNDLAPRLAASLDLKTLKQLQLHFAHHNSHRKDRS